MNPLDYAILAERAYTDAPTVGKADSASRMHVYGDTHVFRGSDDIKSFLADGNCALIEVAGLGRVHAGFYGALAAILPACLALPRPTAVAGHSLGAAMAILYGAVLARFGWIVPVYAFESPRVCDDTEIRDLFELKQVPFYATRNGNDVVTQIPAGLTLPGPMTPIGFAEWPIDNVTDHSIDRVIEALAA